MDRTLCLLCLGIFWGIQARDTTWSECDVGVTRLSCLRDTNSIRHTVLIAFFFRPVTFIWEFPSLLPLNLWHPWFPCDVFYYFIYVYFFVTSICFSFFFFFRFSRHKRRYHKNFKFIFCSKVYFLFALLSGGRERGGGVLYITISEYWT